jgi:hypothetical protein
MRKHMEKNIYKVNEDFERKIKKFIRKRINVQDSY